MKLIDKINKKLKKNYKLLIISLVVIMLLMSFFKSFVFIMIFLVLAVVTGLLSRFVPEYGVAFETIMLSTVLCGYVYGAKAGAFMGVASVVLYYIASGQFTIEIVAFIPLYALAGVAAASMTSLPIATVGIILTAVYILISCSLSFFAFGFSLNENIIFGVLNFVINYIFFVYLAPVIVRLM